MFYTLYSPTSPTPLPSAPHRFLFAVRDSGGRLCFILYTLTSATLEDASTPARWSGASASCADSSAFASPVPPRLASPCVSFFILYTLYFPLCELLLSLPLTDSALCMSPTLECVSWGRLQWSSSACSSGAMRISGGDTTTAPSSSTCCGCPFIGQRLGRAIRGLE